MSAEATEELTNPDLIPLSVTPEQRLADARREVRFEARCADVEEFIVAFEGFVDADTLVLPHHPHLTIGGDCDFVIRLRRGGRELLRGRCSGLELLSDGSGFRNRATGVRVRVLEIDETCREIHQRLIARRRLGIVADGRLARLQMLIQLAIPRPADRVRPSSSERLASSSSDGPTIVDGQVRTQAPALAQAPLPTTPAPRAPLAGGLAPHQSASTPVPGLPPALAVDERATEPSAPLLVLARPPVRVRVQQWAMVAADRAAPLIRSLLATARPLIRRHGRTMLVGIIAFALGFAARGGSHAEPPPAAPVPHQASAPATAPALPTPAATAARPTEVAQEVWPTRPAPRAANPSPPSRRSGGLRRKHLDR